jgi:pilus assembly protein CpaB
MDLTKARETPETGGMKVAKLSGKGPIVIAIVLAVITTGLIFVYLKGATTTTADTKPGLPVVVAKADIPPMTEVTPDMVQIVQVPPEYVQPGVIGDVNKVVGHVTKTAIVANQQITNRELVGNDGGFTGLIPRNKRAVSIKTDDVIGVTGFIRPGDYVDIIATFDQDKAGKWVSKVILQNVLVLAVYRDTGATGAGNPEQDKDSKDKDKDKEANSKVTLTLAVSPDEATRMTESEQHGTLRLALRPKTPSNPIAVTLPVTPPELMDQPRTSFSSTQASAAAPPSPPAHQAQALQEIPVQVIRGTEITVVPVNR